MLQVLKQLHINGSSKVDGVLINDSGETSAVFLGALVNPVYFQTLLESGYKLVALPRSGSDESILMSFEKDGQFLIDLPVDNYFCNDKETEMMYNMIYDQMSADDLKKHLTASTASKFIEMPLAKPFINTREELEAYLLSYEQFHTDTDCLPLNYIASQNALYSLEEFFPTDETEAEKMHHIRSIIEKRRTLTYNQFQFLFKWLQDKLPSLGADYNLKADSVAFDFVNCYFAWGICGLRWDIVVRRITDADRSVDEQFRGVNKRKERYCIGLTDINKSVIVPEMFGPERPWTLSIGGKAKYQNEFLDMEGNPRTDLEPGKLIVVDYVLPIKNRQILMDGKECSYIIDNENIAISQCSAVMYPQKMTSIKVKGFSTNTEIDLRYALPSGENKEYIQKTEYLNALANEIIEKRFVYSDATSYKALLMAGFDPKSAIMYVAYENDLMCTSKTAATSNPNLLVDKDVTDYLDGIITETTDIDKIKYIEGSPQPSGTGAEKWQIINDIVTGVINCNNIANAISRENAITSNVIYRKLFCVHFILGVDLDDIAKAVENAKVGEILTFSGQNKTLTISMEKINFRQKANIEDITYYRIQEVTNAQILIHVITAAREISCRKYDRDVGVLVYRLDRVPNSAVDMVFCKLEQKYRDLVMEQLPLEGLDEIQSTRTLNMIKHYKAQARLIVTRAMFNMIVHSQSQSDPKFGKFTLFALPDKQEYTFDLETKDFNTIMNKTVTQIESLDGITVNTCRFQTKLLTIHEQVYATDGTPMYQPDGEPVTTESFVTGIDPKYPMDWGVFCANAYILPDRVLAVPGTTIKEISARPLLLNEIHQDQKLVDSLRKAGVINSYSEVWAPNLTTKQFVERDFDQLQTSTWARLGVSVNNSLSCYVKKYREDFAEGKEKGLTLVRAQHPSEYLYPALYGNVYDEETDPQYVMTDNTERKRVVLDSEGNPLTDSFTGEPVIADANMTYATGTEMECLIKSGDNKGMDVAIHMGDVKILKPHIMNNQSLLENNIKPAVRNFRNFDTKTFELHVNIFGMLPEYKDINKLIFVDEVNQSILIKDPNTQDIVTYDVSGPQGLTILQKLVTEGYPITNPRNNIFIVKDERGDYKEIEC